MEQKFRLFVCSGGVSFGLDSILTVLRIDSTKIVYCEEMTYFCALDLLGERGCEARFIPFTPQGVLDLDWLDDKLKSNPEEAARTALGLYLRSDLFHPTNSLSRAT